MLPIEALPFRRDYVRVQLVQKVRPNLPGHVLLPVLAGQPSGKVEKERSLRNLDAAEYGDAS